jgi:hypothetical protein
MEPDSVLVLGGRIEMPILPVVPLDPTIMKWYHVSDSPATIPGNARTFIWRLAPVPDKADMFTDTVFTYTRSDDDGHALYTRRMTKLFFPPDFIDIGTTGKATNGVGEIVYISKYWVNEDKYAITIYSLDTLSNPSVKFRTWQRTEVSDKFVRRNQYSIGITAMEGNRASGYYLTEDEYYSTRSGEPFGVVHAFYIAKCGGSSMDNYVVSNWKYLSDPDIAVQFNN